MPVDLQLVKDGRVIVVTCSDPLSFKEIVDSNEQGQRDFLEKATKPVHTIMDLSDVHRLPSNMLSHSLTLMRSTHPMTGHFVLVAQSAFILAMANLLHRAAPKYPMTMCATLAEAWAVIDKLLASEKTG